MKATIKTLMDRVATPGVDRTCTICGRYLSNSEAGVKSHLRSHVNKGELDSADMIPLSFAILGRKPR